MADFHQPRFVPTVHAVAPDHPAPDRVAALARARGLSVSLVLPALARELDGAAFPRIIRLLARNPLLGRVIVVLGHATADQHRRADALLSCLDMPVTLVRLDDVRLPRIGRQLEKVDLDVRPTGKGYACWVGVSVALAGSGSDVIAMHDCDIVNYRPAMLTRLVAPLVVPDEPFDFAKGYYARVTSRMYGRVTRLLVTPLIRALQQVDITSTLPAFIGDFRYPLAGEVAFSRALAHTLPLHGGWGLEIGMLAEIHSRQRTFKPCQVDIADTYDHRHRPIDAVADGGGLTTMTDDILVTLVRALRRQHATVDTRVMRYVLAHYRTEVSRCIDAYAADAAVNGLVYDRALESATATAFAAAVERCIGQGLCADVATHPSWADVRRLAPCVCDAFAELAIASELVGRGGSPADAGPSSWSASGFDGAVAGS